MAIIRGTARGVYGPVGQERPFRLARVYAPGIASTYYGEDLVVMPFAGQTVKLIADAADAVGPVSYSWLLNGEEYGDTASITVGPYSYEDVTVDWVFDDMQVTITNGEQSESLAFYVYPLVPIGFYEYYMPDEIEVYQGQNIEYIWPGVEFGSWEYAYRWYRKDDRDWRELDNSSVVISNTPRFFKYHNGTQYRVDVTDIVTGETAQKTTTIRVIVAPPQATLQRSDPVLSGEYVTFTLDLSGGVYPYLITWQVNDGAGWQNIAGYTNRLHGVSASTMTQGLSYQTMVVDADNGNQYRVVAVEDYGNGAITVSNVVQLEITPFDIYMSEQDGMLEVYNAWDEDKHAYAAARTVLSYETADGVTTVTCSNDPSGFVADDVVVIDSGDPAIDGERVVSSAADATFSFENPLADPTAEPVVVTGTANWKHRKVIEVAGMKGLYSFTQADVALAPQWDADAQEMLFKRARPYRFDIDPDLITDFRAGTNKARSLTLVVRLSTAYSSTSSGLFLNTLPDTAAIQQNTGTSSYYWWNGSQSAVMNVGGFWGVPPVYDNAMKVFTAEGHSNFRAIMVNRRGASTTGTIDVGHAQVPMSLGRGLDGSMQVAAFADEILGQDFHNRVATWVTDKIYPETLP